MLGAGLGPAPQSNFFPKRCRALRYSRRAGRRRRNESTALSGRVRGRSPGSLANHAAPDLPSRVAAGDMDRLRVRDIDHKIGRVIVDGQSPARRRRPSEFRRNAVEDFPIRLDLDGSRTTDRQASIRPGSGMRLRAREAGSCQSEKHNADTPVVYHLALRGFDAYVMRPFWKEARFLLLFGQVETDSFVSHGECVGFGDRKGNCRKAKSFFFD
jgi:hypothetical protein